MEDSRKMTGTEVLEVTVQILKRINVPVELIEQIGVPIHRAISNLNVVLRAMEQQGNQGKEPEAEKPEGENEE